ncbi:MAG: hypothetical protein AB7Q17_13655 [Phycisphaerae bacterium]
MNASAALQVLHFIAADASDDARAALGALCREPLAPASRDRGEARDRAGVTTDSADRSPGEARQGCIHHIPFCLGVGPTGRVLPPARATSPDAGGWWLRAVRVARAAVHRSSPAIVHAWSRAAGEACAAALAPRRLLGPTLRGVALVIDAELSAAERRRVRGGGLIHRGVDAVIVCRTDAAMRRLRRLGVPADRLFVVRSALDDRETTPSADVRAAARAGLQLDPEDVAVLALPPLGRGAGFLAAWAVLLLERVLPGVRVIVPGGGESARRFEAVVRDCQREGILRVASPTCSLGSLVAAADVAISAGCDAGSLDALLLAAAAHVPIVAADTAAVREVLSQAGVARFFEPGVPKDAARQLLRTIEAPDANATQLRAAAELAAGATRGVQRAAYERLYVEIAARVRAAHAPVGACC